MTNLNTDLRLLSNRKAIELNSLSNLNAYDLRSAQIKINWKYEVTAIISPKRRAKEGAFISFFWLKSYL